MFRGKEKAAAVRMAADKGVAYGKDSEGGAATAVCSALEQVTFVIHFECVVYSKPTSNRCVRFTF